MVFTFIGLFVFSPGLRAATYSHYFSIEKSSINLQSTETNWPDLHDVYSHSQFDTPIEVLERAHANALQVIKRVFALTNFKRTDQIWGEPAIPYKRTRDFGGWVRFRSPGRCLNTRGLVLERDSQVPVSLSSDKCTVVGGKWLDPYTGNELTDARDIQIDHFVPLKNAYISGADQWNSQERCLYANFMGNSYHLLPVWGPENSRKSDKPIDGYLPPNNNYRCQYVAQWLKIKYIWKLKLSPNEVEQVQRMLRNGECSAGQFQMDETEETAIKDYKLKNSQLCRI